MFLPRENARYVLGPVPLLVIGDAPIHAPLPPLHAPEGRMPTCQGWQIMAKLTLCVVDGPGDAGCLIPTLTTPDQAEDMAEWCAAVAGAGGAVVVSVPQLPSELDWDELFTGGIARGGFVRSAG